MVNKAVLPVLALALSMGAASAQAFPDQRAAPERPDSIQALAALDAASGPVAVSMNATIDATAPQAIFVPVVEKGHDR
jgi:hypothetical protein